MTCTKGALLRGYTGGGPEHEIRRCFADALNQGCIRLRRKLLLKGFNAIQFSSDLFFFKAVLCEGALRDDTKNGCGAD